MDINERIEREHEKAKRIIEESNGNITPEKFLKKMTKYTVSEKLITDKEKFLEIYYYKHLKEFRNIK